MSVQPRRDVAVFIDFENIYVSVRDKLDSNPNFEIIMDHCNQLGRVILARAFADWYRYPRITSALYANNIEPMYVPTYYYDKGAGRTGGPIKNSVDMNLCIDAMRTLFTMPGLSTFVLITGDRDFIPLVNTIRQQGKDVIIIGVGGAASSHLAQSADEFLFYEQMVGKAELTAAKPEPRRLTEGDEYERPQSRERLSGRSRGRDESRAETRRVEEQRPAAAAAMTEDGAFALLAKVVLEARARNMVTGIGSLKTLMRELSNGEFRESVVRDANGRPVQSFKEFITEAARREKIIISTEGVVNEVFLPGEDPKALSQFATTETPDKKDADAALTADDRAAAAFSSANGDKGRRRRRRGGDRNGNGRTDGAVKDTAPTERDDELAIPATVAPAAAPRQEVPEPRLNSIVSVIDEHDTVGETAVAIPFTDEERQSVRDIVAASERPLSFQQIYDTLRGSRNRGGDATIARTNEDLRSLVKLAINTGELQRIGRGNRVTYRLPVVTTDAESAPISETPASAAISTPVRTEPVMIPTPADSSDEPLLPPAAPTGAIAAPATTARRRVKQPAAAPTAVAPTAPSLDDLSAAAQPRRRGPKPKTAPTSQAELAAPSAPAASAPTPKQPVKQAGKQPAKPATQVPARRAGTASERPAAAAAAKPNTPSRGVGRPPKAAPATTPTTDSAPVAPNKPRRRTKPEA